MDYNKKQNVYKIIMLVVLVMVITFIGTTLFMYRYINLDDVKYVQVTAKDTKIANTLASFRKIVEAKKLASPSSYQSLQFNEWIGRTVAHLS